MGLRFHQPHQRRAAADSPRLQFCGRVYFESLLQESTDHPAEAIFYCCIKHFPIYPRIKAGQAKKQPQSFVHSFAFAFFLNVAVGWTIIYNGEYN